MRNYLLFLILLFTSLTVNSQTNVSVKSTEFKKPNWLKKCNLTKEAEKKILFEYGAVYLSQVFEPDTSIRPSKCRFQNSSEVEQFAKSFKTVDNEPVFAKFYLQTEAKVKLLEAFADLNGRQNVARNCNDKPETCTDGINNDWAFRDYEQAYRNWINHLASKLRTKTFDDVVRDHSEYIYSYAIPGGSQHHLRFSN